MSDRVCMHVPKEAQWLCLHYLKSIALTNKGIQMEKLEGKRVLLYILKGTAWLDIVSVLCYISWHQLSLQVTLVSIFYSS